MLADSANKFKNAGGQLKRQMRCRLIKIYLFFGILITAALAGIIAYFVCVPPPSRGRPRPRPRLRPTPHPRPRVLTPPAPSPAARSDANKKK